MRPSFLRLQSPYLAAIVAEATPDLTITDQTTPITKPAANFGPLSNPKHRLFITTNLNHPNYP